MYINDDNEPKIKNPINFISRREATRNLNQKLVERFLPSIEMADIK